ncbi:MAG TPA: hypothetical protein DD670_07510 [Planctomycetaceae bacterium]|nr:hypothetical protein [Planctomycetaceae bacterium]
MKCRACVLSLSFVAAVCIAESASAYYNSSLGRFVSRDPIGYEGSKSNLYEYVGGRPVQDLDPEGLEPKLTAQMATDAALVKSG